MLAWGKFEAKTVGKQSVSKNQIKCGNQWETYSDTLQMKAFDIDGVLVRGGRPIPEAVQAMKVLNGANKYGIKM